MAKQQNEKILEFNQKKEVYLKEKKALDDLLLEKERTKSIKEALETELSDLIEKAKSSPTITDLDVEKFVELKQQTTGIRARLDYYNAAIFEQDEKIYNQKEVIFNKCKELKYIRSDFAYEEAKKLLFVFVENNKDKLSEVYDLFSLSLRFDPNYYIDDKSKEEKIKEFIEEAIFNSIDTHSSFYEEYHIPIFINETEIKSPAKKHFERVSDEKNSTPKGFSALINNL